MTDIIDLSDARNRRERPDESMVRRDDFGREMYLFALEYEFEDGLWSTQLWAYSMDDAQRRVEAMRSTLALRGQMFGATPA